MSNPADFQIVRGVLFFRNRMPLISDKGSVHFKMEDIRDSAQGCCLFPMQPPEPGKATGVQAR